MSTKSLISAVVAGDSQRVRDALEAGADPNEFGAETTFRRGKMQVNALTVAVIEGKFGIIDILLEHPEIDMNLRIWWMKRPITIPHIAMYARNLEMFERLLDDGRYEETELYGLLSDAVHSKILNEMPEMIVMIYEKLYSDGRGPARTLKNVIKHIAVYFSETKMRKIAKVLFTDPRIDQAYALYTSITWGSEDIVRAMLQSGADPGMVYEKQPMIVHAVEGGHGTSIEIFEMLREGIAELPDSIFFRAVYYGYVPMVEHILSLPGFENAVNEDFGNDKVPLSVAFIARGDEEMFQYILSRGDADVTHPAVLARFIKTCEKPQDELLTLTAWNGRWPARRLERLVMLANHEDFIVPKKYKKIIRAAELLLWDEQFSSGDVPLLPNEKYY